jgi:hypothetical protein
MKKKIPKFKRSLPRIMGYAVFDERDKICCVPNLFESEDKPLAIFLRKKELNKYVAQKLKVKIKPVTITY